jgi:Ca2+-binding RTX toxin-like protein
VTCPAPQGVLVDAQDGDDIVRVGLGTTVPVAVAAGPGNDLLEGGDLLAGGPGDDEIEGHDGDDVLGGGDGDDVIDGGLGRDALAGGPGDDLLRPDGYEPPSADWVRGRPGFDRIERDWSDRTDPGPKPPLHVTLGGYADDGRPGEGDDVQEVESLVVTAGGRFVGTPAAEHVKVQQVGDAVDLRGGGGADRLEAGDGPDRVAGGPGDDALDGGFGDDRIVGGRGRDTISADKAGGDCGPLWCKYPWGNDLVDVRDGEADSVSCGAGTDRVRADALDVVAGDCEAVERGGAGSGRPGATRRARRRAGRPRPAQGGSLQARGPVLTARARRVLQRARGTSRRRPSD